MNTVYMVTITLNDEDVFEFVVYDSFEKASFLAGECIDRLSDDTGYITFDYDVRKAPYVSATTAPIEIVRAAVTVLPK